MSAPTETALDPRTELATRTAIAYDVLLTAACVFPNDVPTRPGFRDLLHRVVDDLKRLSDEAQLLSLMRL